MTVYEITESKIDFIITEHEGKDVKLVFRSPVGADIKKYIMEHEGTYYIRSTKWQDDLVNVREPS